MDETGQSKLDLENVTFPREYPNTSELDLDKAKLEPSTTMLPSHELYSCIVGDTEKEEWAARGTVVGAAGRSCDTCEPCHHSDHTIMGFMTGFITHDAPNVYFGIKPDS